MEQKPYQLLLVEDDRIDQLAFKKMVDQKVLNYQYDVVSSVAEAKAVLRQKAYDAVITDYMLGDGTAFDILEVLVDIPIIITTGAGNEQIAVKAMKRGAYDYLIKDTEGSYLKVLPITIENAIMRMKNQKQLRMLSHAVMSIGDSVYITDMEDRITYINQAFVKTYGYTERDVMGCSSCILSTSATAGACRRDEPDWGLEEAYDNESLHVKKDGTTFPVLVSRSYVKDENGSRVAIVGVVRDISEIREAQKKLNIYATTDLLTGVLNRRAGLLVLEKNLQMRKRNGEALTVCYIDVDKLKQVNDRHGHQAGDELIVTATNILKEVLRESDTICRIGGDEFLIILPDCDIEKAEQVWCRVEQRLNQINDQHEKPYQVHLSRGFVQYDPHIYNAAEALIATADIEMYKNKSKHLDKK